jgi:hypothetical protein
MREFKVAVIVEIADQLQIVGLLQPLFQIAEMEFTVVGDNRQKPPLL